MAAKIGPVGSILVAKVVCRDQFWQIFCKIGPARLMLRGTNFSMTVQIQKYDYPVHSTVHYPTRNLLRRLGLFLVASSFKTFDHYIASYIYPGKLVRVNMSI